MPFYFEYKKNTNKKKEGILYVRTRVHASGASPRGHREGALAWQTFVAGAQTAMLVIII